MTSHSKYSKCFIVHNRAVVLAELGKLLHTLLKREKGNGWKRSTREIHDWDREVLLSSRVMIRLENRHLDLGCSAPLPWTSMAVWTRPKHPLLWDPAQGPLGWSYPLRNWSGLCKPESPWSGCLLCLGDWSGPNRGTTSHCVVIQSW